MRSSFVLLILALAGCTSAPEEGMSIVLFNARDEATTIDVLVTIGTRARKSEHHVGPGESVEAPAVTETSAFSVLVRAENLSNSALYDFATRPPFLIGCVGETDVTLIAARDLSLLPKLQSRDVAPPERPSCLDP